MLGRPLQHPHAIIPSKAVSSGAEELFDFCCPRGAAAIVVYSALVAKITQGFVAWERLYLLLCFRQQNALDQTCPFLFVLLPAWKDL